MRISSLAMLKKLSYFEVVRKWWFYLVRLYWFRSLRFQASTTMRLGSSFLWDNVMVTSNAPMPCNIPEERRPEYGLFRQIIFMCGKSVALFITLPKYIKENSWFQAKSLFLILQVWFLIQ